MHKPSSTIHPVFCWLLCFLVPIVFCIQIFQYTRTMDKLAEMDHEDRMMDIEMDAVRYDDPHAIEKIEAIGKKYLRKED